MPRPSKQNQPATFKVAINITVSSSALVLFVPALARIDWKEIIEWLLKTWFN